VQSDANGVTYKISPCFGEYKRVAQSAHFSQLKPWYGTVHEENNAIKQSRSNSDIKRCTRDADN